MVRNYKKLFPVAILGLIAIALSALPGEAQQNKKTSSVRAKPTSSKPQVMRAVRFGESKPLRDMPTTREVDISSLESMEGRILNKRNPALGSGQSAVGSIN